MKKTIALLGLLLINGQAIADKIDTRLEAIADDFEKTLCSEEGRTISVDECPKHLAFLKKYANQNKPAAQFALAVCYYADDAPQRVQQAIKLYRKSASQGYAKAQETLARLYEYDEKMKDAAQSLEWRRKAAENGDADAQYNLAEMYEEGKGGVNQDVAQAVEWYRKSANHWYREASVHPNDAYFCMEGSAASKLAEIYEDGKGSVKQDVAQAVEWYRKLAIAANRGYRDTYIKKLGEIYENGKGNVKKDVAQAIEWYRKAGETSAVERLTKTTP